MINRKYYTLLIIGLLSLSVFTSCVDDYHEDPNRPGEGSVNASALLPNIEAKTFDLINTNIGLANRNMVYIDGAPDAQYYDWERGDFFDQYYDIKEIEKMKAAAEENGEEVYKPIGDFLRVYHILDMSQHFGDVPYNDAISTEEDIEGKSFEYDRQKDIFIGALDELEEINNKLANSEESLEGDIIFGGDLKQWQKLVNAYRLRVLISLSEKTDDDDLDVEQRFANIVSNSGENPLMKDNADNGALHYQDQIETRYPFYKNNPFQTAYFMEESFVDKLKENQDPRLFEIAEKKSNTDNVDENDPFSYYGGLYGSDGTGDNSSKAGAGNASRLKPRYWEDPINEPSLLMSYAEQEFIIAEAAVRGWINDDATLHYEKGIHASMNFFEVTLEDAQAYLDQTGVELESGREIEQIMNEKHVALFMNTGWQIFFENRRTGYPELNNDGSGATHGGDIPKRWRYPSDEVNENKENLNKAIDRQFDGDDSRFAEMWLIK